MSIFAVLDTEIYMRTIQDLAKYRLSEVMIRKLNKFEISLIDIFVVKSKPLVDGTFPYNQMSKLFSSGQDFLDDIFNAPEYKGCNLLSSGVSSMQYVEDKETRVWNAFVYFLKYGTLRVTASDEFNSDLLEVLERRGAINFDLETESYNLDVHEIYARRLRARFGVPIPFVKDRRSAIRIPKNKEKMKQKKYTIDSYLNRKKEYCDLLSLVFEGRDISTVAAMFNISESQVNEKIDNLRDSLLAITEVKKYKDIFCQFDISKEVFTKNIDSDGRVYELLKLLYKRGTEEITSEILAEYFGVVNNEAFGERLDAPNNIGLCENTKSSNVRKIFDRFGKVQEYFMMNELMFLYAESVMNFPECAIIDEVEMQGYLNSLSDIIESDEKGFRIYKSVIGEDNNRVLRQVFDTLPEGLYHMDYMFQRYKEVMSRMDIREASELYNLISKGKIALSGIRLEGKYEFAKGLESKEELIFKKLREYDGKALDIFIFRMNIEFGAHKIELEDYLNHHFNEFIVNRCIKIQNFDYEAILPSLNEIIDDEIYTAEDFYRILSDNVSQYIYNEGMVYKLGYIKKGDYILKRKYSSVREALNGKIFKAKFLTVDDSAVYKTADFKTLLNSLEKEFRLLKLDENKYLNIEYAQAHRGLDIQDFKLFLYDAEEFIGENQYFSISSMLQEGFKSKMVDQGYSELTLNRLLNNSDKFKIITQKSPSIYFKGQEKKLDDFLWDMLIEFVAVDIDDFVDELNQYYGTDLDGQNVRTRLVKNGAFFSSEMNRIYINKSEFLREIDDKWTY